MICCHTKSVRKGTKLQLQRDQYSKYQSSWVKYIKESILHVINLLDQLAHSLIQISQARGHRLHRFLSFFLPQTMQHTTFISINCHKSSVASDTRLRQLDYISFIIYFQIQSNNTFWTEWYKFIYPYLLSSNSHKTQRNITLDFLFFSSSTRCKSQKKIWLQFLLNNPLLRHFRQNKLCRKTNMKMNLL